MDALLPFAIARLPRIVFGAGSVDTVPAEAQALGRKALIVTGARSFRDTPRWQALLDGLAAADVAWSDVRVDGEPSPELVDEVRKHGDPDHGDVHVLSSPYGVEGNPDKQGPPPSSMRGASCGA